MVEELKECPFCGSEYTQVRWIGFKHRSNGAYEAGYRGECTDCFSMTRAYPTEQEAIAAWNTRYERTCENNMKDEDEYSFECSECLWDNLTTEDMPASEILFCPNCGVRVVGD